MEMIVVRGHIREFHDMILALLCLNLRAQYSRRFLYSLDS